MWDKVRNWFHDSEVIFFARLQTFVGIVWTVLATTNLAPLLSPKVLTWWLIASGIITEVARRSRAQL